MLAVYFFLIVAIPQAAAPGATQSLETESHGDFCLNIP